MDVEVGSGQSSFTDLLQLLISGQGSAHQSFEDFVKAYRIYPNHITSELMEIEAL